MPRVKRGIQHVKRRRSLLKRAKGFGGRRGRGMKAMQESIVKAGVHAYRGRKLKKRDNRAIWQIKISAATRARGMSYSQFIAALHKANIELDRKVLANLAEYHASVFDAIVETVKK
jgi:large subunit ribosomal protein L20